MLLKHNMHSFLIKDIQTNKLHLNRQIQRDTQTLAADDVSFDSFKYIMPPFVFAAAQFRKTNAKCRWPEGANCVGAKTIQTNVLLNLSVYGVDSSAINK